MLSDTVVSLYRIVVETARKQHTAAGGLPLNFALGVFYDGLQP